MRWLEYHLIFRRRRKLKTKKKLNLKPLFFIGPHMLLFLTFIVIPTVYGIYVSFTKWNLVGKPEWVGLANYKTILFNTKSTFHFQFFNGMKNTLIYVVLIVPLMIIIPLLVAVALEHKKVKFKNLFPSYFVCARIDFNLSRSFDLVFAFPLKTRYC